MAACVLPVRSKLAPSPRVFSSGSDVDSRAGVHRGAGVGSPERGEGGGRGASGSLNSTQYNKSAETDEKGASLFAFNRSLCKALRATGLSHVAEQVEACHTAFDGRKCKPGGHRWAKPVKSCSIRLCAFDMRTRRARVLRQFEPVVAAMKDARFMVLTVRNSRLGSLDKGLTELFEAFERLRHGRLWKKSVTGAIMALEITYNAQKKSWHPHLNVIFDGEYIPQALLSKTWGRCTRGKGNVVWIGRPRDLREVFKYVVKLQDITSSPDAVAELLRATRGARFIRTYGSLYRLKVEEEETGPEACPDCGSHEIEHVGRVRTVFYDGQGILRFEEEGLLAELARAAPVPMSRAELETMWFGMDREQAAENLQRRIALTSLEESAASNGALLFDAA